ncbi:helix-turn-helix domain-containing protein [Protofrankia symbiont of Coriaria ruscifolia]|uniref:helix-turn-helix domain-containing protein n=1 Tax=Protofrankia symbiont of Coriaria ruscifolia TaxID=1306542 RepID=UPI00104107ED
MRRLRSRAIFNGTSFGSLTFRTSIFGLAWLIPSRSCLPVCLRLWDKLSLETSKTYGHTRGVSNEYRFLKKFGSRIAELRRKRALTQEKLAELVGVDRSYIGYVERGQRNPSVGVVHRIAKVVGVSLAELFKPF